MIKWVKEFINDPFGRNGDEKVIQNIYQEAADKKAKIDKERKRKIVEWVKDKFSKIKCEICKKNKFIKDTDSLGKIRCSNIEGTIKDEGRAYIHTHIVCQNCGNTKLINWGIIGIRDEEEENDE